mmetsp:Transcript_17509/g.34170  ORF Transcript_17509/g.34170 Transcript_17509/m.34170 type:complete len:172 (-) Transcript_17509:373-888(-)|eukprot:CAMPEP_0172655806 /NCGR_PEP_ID=MMETSP1074-20121228/932_1 /TAXON_ID=2916 /ORGANISM="Ceratium fusus, Strain PA161109" /LENGTH=171 /DNA_ID=CAMNT_0013470537 /DNA_START=58 /DNA_END=573 /DNA_ORIENTATION=-
MPPVHPLLFQQILLASTPDDALHRARKTVKQHGGFSAVLAKESPLSPERIHMSQFLMHMMVHMKEMNFTALKDIMGDLVASLTMKQRWKLVWEGSVAASLQMLHDIHPGDSVCVVAIKGGVNCDWEQKQLSDGGKLKKLFPNITLVVFKDTDELEQALSSRGVGAFGQGAS